MLQIGPDLLPQSLLSYVAFRVALRHTWDQLDLVVSGSLHPDDAEGFLTEVPLLQEAPLHVQLDVLAATWDRHSAGSPVTADLLDESVIYAACELTSRLAQHFPQRVLWALHKGPHEICVPVDEALASELRGLYLRLSNEGDFLIASQLLDLPPHEASEWKKHLGICEHRLDQLFEILGRWHMSVGFLSNLIGLVTDAEAERLRRLVGV